MEQQGIYIRSKRSFTLSITILTTVLLVMWIPVTVDKLTSFDSFKAGMLKQPLPVSLTTFLAYTIPVLELFTVLLLVFKKYRRWGFYFSLGLLALFTGYVGLALLGVWAKMPCGCGSVISGMSWPAHLLFNTSFLILNAYGIYLLNKKRGACHQ